MLGGVQAFLQSDLVLRSAHAHVAQGLVEATRSGQPVAPITSQGSNLKHNKRKALAGLSSIANARVQWQSALICCCCGPNLTPQFAPAPCRQPAGMYMALLAPLTRNRLPGASVDADFGAGAWATIV